ncbi:hypothetical protein L209DRAFT_760449 [Thermothelomyces heterothallicus CBS 203.75]
MHCPKPCEDSGVQSLGALRSLQALWERQCSLPPVESGSAANPSTPQTIAVLHHKDPPRPVSKNVSFYALEQHVSGSPCNACQRLLPSC